MSDVILMPEIIEGAELSPLTTIKLGGKARWMAVCRSVAELRGALEFAREKNARVHVLGGGSNTIFSDEGFDGVVVKVDLKGIEFTVEGEGVLVKAEAGEGWDEFVQAAVEKGLNGIECLSGIPGTVGAAPVQNIGAYGQSVSDTITAVFVLDRNTLEEKRIGNKDCGFGYRTSVFKGRDAGRYIVTAVEFALGTGDGVVLSYPELQNKLRDMQSESKRPVSPSLAREAVLDLRSGKGMVEQSGLNTCGSFFMNAILSEEELSRVKSVAGLGENGAQVPVFPMEGGRFKLSAAWLIENCGYGKGYRKGGVGLSPFHALALVNYEGTTTELTEFASEIEDRVKEKFGVKLTREPVMVGF